jgi:phospholipid/cholesterol/gamma-HCH transport system substrate-binding protein
MTTLTRRRTRTKRRSDIPGPLSTVARGFAALMVVIIFVGLGVEAFNGVPGRSFTTLNAVVPNIGNLLEHDPVSIAGVNVGQILGRSIAPNGEGELQLQLMPGIMLRSGTQVMIRANGLLGGRYVQLIPGSGPRVLRSGATITGGRNSLTFGVPETLDTFDPSTRRALGHTVNGLGAGLIGRGIQINTAIHTMNGVAVPFVRVVDGILARPGAARRLLPSLRSATIPLAANRIDLADLPRAVSAALQPLLDQKRALVQTLTGLPPTLTAAIGGLDNGNRLVTALTTLARAADRTLPPLPSGLSDAAALLTQARVPLERTDGLLRAAVPAAPGILDIAHSAVPLLAPLRQASNNLTPMLVQIGRYGCDVENFGAVFRSMTGRGGVGSGPNGPAMEFRVQLSLLNPTQSLGLPGLRGAGVHDTYSPPCTYLSTTYPAAF